MDHFHSGRRAANIAAPFTGNNRIFPIRRAASRRIPHSGAPKLQLCARFAPGASVLGLEDAVPEMMAPAEVCDFLKIDNETLKKWRRTGRGPRPFQLSHSLIRYKVSDVLAWVEARGASATEGSKRHGTSR